MTIAPNKQSTAIAQLLKKCRSVFRAFQSFFWAEWSHRPPAYGHVALFQLHYEKLDEDARQALNSHKQLLMMLGYQVQEEQSREETPPECIGRLTCWSAKKLIFQEVLLRQEVHSVETVISFERISQPILSASASAFYNDLIP